MMMKKNKKKKRSSSTSSSNWSSVNRSISMLSRVYLQIFNMPIKHIFFVSLCVYCLLFIYFFLEYAMTKYTVNTRTVRAALILEHRTHEFIAIYPSFNRTSFSRSFVRLFFFQIRFLFLHLAIAFVFVCLSPHQATDQ